MPFRLGTKSRAALGAALFVCAALLFAGHAMTMQAHAADGEAALLTAARIGDAAAVSKLLGQGIKPDIRDAEKRTPLLLATHADHVAVAHALIAAGADVNAKDAIEDTPFLYAGAEGRLDILKLTLAAGADLKSTNRYGGTALIPACHHGYVETVRELLKTAINVNHVNNLGWTALLEAVILGDGGARYRDIVGQLIAARANVNLADREGRTPLAHAKARGYDEIARALAAAGGH
jgi:ankyrin repeat protein